MQDMAENRIVADFIHERLTGLSSSASENKESCNESWQYQVQINTPELTKFKHVQHITRSITAVRRRPIGFRQHHPRMIATRDNSAAGKTLISSRTRMVATPNDRNILQVPSLKSIEMPEAALPQAVQAPVSKSSSPQSTSSTIGLEVLRALHPTPAVCGRGQVR
jgi:hypothetical protein